MLLPWVDCSIAATAVSLAVTAVSLAASAVTHSFLLLVVGHSSLLLAPLSLSLSLSVHTTPSYVRALAKPLAGTAGAT